MGAMENLVSGIVFLNEWKAVNSGVARMNKLRGHSMGTLSACV